MISELKTSHVFTPEQLFGDIEIAGLSRHAVFLERATAEAERDEAAANSALGTYLVARLIDAYLCFIQKDMGAWDGLLWQVRAVRRHIAGLPAEAPETNHLAGIVDALPVADGGLGAIGPLRISLTAYSYFLEHESRLQEALEFLALAARAHTEEVGAAEFAMYGVLAGKLNRLLARWPQAIACYGAAEEAARFVGDSVLMLRARIGRGAVCRGQGNLPMARQIAEAVVREAAELQLAEVQAVAYAELGFVLSALGLRVEGIRANYRAFLLTPDPVQRMRTLGDLGTDLLEIGAHGAARLAFEIVINSKTNHILRTNALLELMDLESTIGNRVAFERCRAAAETDRERMPPSMATDFLYKIGIGMARFGQLRRATEALRAAIKIAETHALNAWYFKIEKALHDLDRYQEQQRVSLEPEESDAAPVIKEMEMGLREYAALQPA